MKEYTIDNLPDDALPGLDELTGDMQILAEMVGVRMALKIAEYFGGTPLQLYGHKKWIIRWRDRLIRTEYDLGGISVIELARKYSLSDRQMYNILGQDSGSDRQLKLFK